MSSTITELPKLYSVHCHAFMWKANSADALLAFFRAVRDDPALLTEEESSTAAELFDDFSALVQEQPRLFSQEQIQALSALCEASPDLITDESPAVGEAHVSSVNLDETEHGGSAGDRENDLIAEYETRDALARMVDDLLQLMGFRTDLEEDTGSKSIWIEALEDADEYDPRLERLFSPIAGYFDGILLFILASPGMRASDQIIRWDLNGSLHIQNPLLSGKHP